MNTGLFLETYTTWFGAAAVILSISALASILHSSVHGRKAKVVWILLVLLLPVFGAIAWFALGRQAKKEQP